MPSNWLYIDSRFPNFNGDETTEEKLDQLQNYLYMLVEQMRYLTQNLDLSNVNQTALNNWETAITRPIYAKIEGEGERITQLSITADGIQAQVQGQTESIQELEDSAQDQIQVIQEVQQALGEQGGTITDIQGTVTAQQEQMAQLELTAQGLAATVQEQETKFTEFESTLTQQGEDMGTLEGTIQSQSEKLAQLALTADGLAATVEEQSQTVTEIHNTVTNQGQQITEQASRIGNLEVGAGTISAEVSRIESTTNATLDGVNQSISQLSERVNLSLTTDQVDIAIEKKLSDGVETVRTSTGFTFDEVGMTVRKSGSEMSTQVTENGMVVRRSEKDMLVVNASGVKATNLDADTYMTVGNRSRFEKYGDNRMGCFWTGG